MNQYRYKAINLEGKYVNGSMASENPSDLTTNLKNKGLELISFKIESNNSIGSFFNKVKNKDLITIFLHLEQMDRAGISIVDSICDLRDTAENPKIKNLMHEIHDSIRNGNLFSESLAKHPDIFGKVYIGLIGTAEKTGHLADAFSSIMDDLKWNMEMKRKIKKATFGPLFGVSLMFTVIGVMTTVVVPKITEFLTSQQISLPFTTIALVAFSGFMKKYWSMLILTPIILNLTIKMLAKNQELAVKIDYLKLKIPVIGGVINKIDAARFCQFFSMTFQSGLGVIECLDSASNVVKNTAIKRSINIIKQQVSDGQPLAVGIASSGYFPNLVIRMFKIGEESGNMESSLKNIKFFYDREINDSIDQLIGLMQPTLTFVMGGLIFWIAIAVFGPIYGSFSKTM